MTEHLPECPVERMLRNGKTVGSQTCICAALRSCEQRVEESMDRAWEQTVQLAVAHTRTATRDLCFGVGGAMGQHEWLELKGYADGYSAALNAVREAVEEMDLHGCLPHQGPIGCNCVGPKVIAAIDGLR